MLHPRHGLRKSTHWFSVVAVFAIAGLVHPASAQSIRIETLDVVLSNVPFDVTVRIDEPVDSVGPVTLSVGEWSSSAPFDDGAATFSNVMIGGASSIEARLGADQVVATASPVVLPGWISILPALFAILVALVFRQVIPAIFAGIWLGAWLTKGLSFAGLFTGLLETIEVYVLESLSDTGHLSILLFTLMIGGMIGIVSANGGTIGIVNKIVRFASSPKRGQFTTAFLGVAIFFDDYANTLIVGNTMRPVTDRLRVSREKLSYIVDSTAAPVAALALVTTWIGYEVGLIDTAVRGIEGYGEAAYSVFLNSIAYSYYPILAILFVFAVAVSGRDFGPMYRAEIRARVTGEVSRPGASTGEGEAESHAVEPKEGKPRRALNAVIPVLVLVLGTMVGIYVTGVSASTPGAGLREIIGNGDSYKSLVWASLAGVMVAALLSIIQRILTLEEVVESWYAGLKSMMFASIILILAWSLSGVNDALSTGPYLATVLGGQLDPAWLPAVVFILSAITAFATGSSWGVMGIIMPLVVPLSWAVMLANDLHRDPNDYHILYSAVSAVLAGAVWGDHCSPISDTTILSSLASGCDHIDHVRTQLPYALTVGMVGLLFGTIPAGFGLPPWFGMLLGAAVLIGLLAVVGKPIDALPHEHTD